MNKLLTIFSLLVLLGSCRNNFMNFETLGKNCTTMQYNDGTDKVSVSYSGDFVINDAETAFESMTPDAFVYFDKGGRKFKATANKAGEITYSINGDKVTFNENEKSMLKDIMIELSEFGIDADAKCRKLLIASGVKGIIGKIDQLKNDNVKNKYLSFIFENGNPNNDNINEMLLKIKNISADYDKAALLTKVKVDYLKETATGTLFMNTVNSIESDYDKANVLKYALGTCVNFEEQALTQAIEGIESDYDLKNVLEIFIKSRNFSPAELAAFCNATKSIDSDFDKANVLKHFTQNREMLRQI
jgi:hypothetical protein